jgi:isonocardicin synthase
MNIKNNALPEMNLPLEKEAQKERDIEKKLLSKPLHLCDHAFHFESWSHFPQNIFIFNTNGQECWGRKLISKRHKSGDLMEMHCSLIEPFMVLGRYNGFCTTESGVFIYYDPTDRIKDFQEVNEYDDYIDFPFSYLDSRNKQERASPKTGWQLTKYRKENLTEGEKHIREHAIEHIKSLDFKQEVVVFDPACSTGVFLEAIKQKFPNFKTIGQDLNPDMIKEASKKIDTAFCGCASNPFVPPSSCDLVYIRFLNSEVVNRQFSQDILPTILERVKVGGYAIILGHTPVLLPRVLLKKLKKFKQESSIAFLPDKSAMFQYYVLKRTC